MLAADVAGYTRLMEADEEATLAAWWAARKNVIDPTIAAAPRADRQAHG